MDKLKAKEDLPVDIRVQGKSPVLLVAADSKIPDELLRGLSALNVNVVILSKHMDLYEKLLWAADMILVLSDKPERVLQDAWSNGVIPICSSFAEGAQNYNPNKETGNSFTFEDENPWKIFAAIVRALETFKFPYDWSHIVSQAQQTL